MKDETRIFVTLTKSYLDALNHLVEEGIYISRVEGILEGIRLFLGTHGITLKRAVVSKRQARERWGLSMDDSTRSGRSKYDIILDKFLKSKSVLSELKIEQADPYNISRGLRKRIKKRNLKLITCVVNGIVYIEKFGEINSS